MSRTARVLFALAVILLAACTMTPTEPTPYPPPTVHPYCAAVTTRAIGLWRDLNLTGLSGELGKGARIAVYLDLDATRYWPNGTLAVYVTAWFGGAEGWLFLNNAPLTWDDPACPGDKLAGLGISWPLPELAAPQTAASSIVAPEGMCAVLWPCAWLVTPGAAETPEPPTAMPTPTDTPTDAPSSPSPTPTYTNTPTLTPIPLTEAPTATPTPTVSPTPTPTRAWYDIWRDNAKLLVNLKLRQSTDIADNVIEIMGRNEYVYYDAAAMLLKPVSDGGPLARYAWASVRTQQGVVGWAVFAVLEGNAITDVYADVHQQLLLVEYVVDGALYFAYLDFDAMRLVDEVLIYTPTPEAWSPSPTPAAPSKLGFHVVSGPRNGFADALRNGAGLVLEVDGAGALYEAETINRDIVTIYRTTAYGDTPEGNWQFSDPPLAADIYYNNQRNVWAATTGDIPVDLFAFLNEPDPPDWSVMVNFSLRAIERADADGYTLVFGNFATGTWNATKIAAMEPVWRALRDGGHFVGLHEYGLVGIGDGTLHASAPDLALRYRQFWAELYDLGLGDLPIVITEAAPFGGYEWDRLGADAFVADVEWYFEELARDPYIVGAALFTLGAWEGHRANYQDVLDRL